MSNNSNGIGLYIHVPFCKSFCPYCDFYKVKNDEDLKVQYVKALKRESEKYRESLTSKVVDTIYFGGGTPSVLSGNSFSSIFESLYKNYNISHDAEITIECNPSSNLEDLIGVLAGLGVNRISMGMQSAKDNERKGLGRLSDAKRVEECLSLIRNNGIENITLDLMIGIPNQTMETLDESLKFIEKSRVPHVSAYMLKLEEGTNFYKRATAKEQYNPLNLPSEDETADMYIHMCEYFESIGLMQYEISNFAVSGMESKHNLKYWHDEEYLGLGPAAHSFINGKRFHMPNNLNAFIDGSQPVEDGFGGSYEERLMLALRLTEGFKGPLSDDTLKAANSPMLSPFLILDENCLRLNRQGFLVSNTIISALI